jgi:cytochrome P450
MTQMGDLVPGYDGGVARVGELGGPLERRKERYPLGAALTIAGLEADPHPFLARLREREPVSWTPVLDSWLVTRRDLALAVMGDSATFTVDDERFSTARVVGRSMLSTDGAEHARHRSPFGPPFRADAVRESFSELVSAETDRLLDAIRPDGRADVRVSFSGPLAASVVTRALGLEGASADDALGWYQAIVEGVSRITAGEEITDAARDAFDELRADAGAAVDLRPGSMLAAAVAADRPISNDEAISNAAVIMFGGIETTDGMIANAIFHLLRHPDARELVSRQPSLLPSAIEESLRLEPAAAVVDRYATRDVVLGGAEIGRGDKVTVSIAAANRDPATFAEPDRFDVRRPNVQRHAAFARGPHVCVGMHLARLEAHTAVRRALETLPGLRLDGPPDEAAPRGLVFRKPPALRVRWND